MRWFYVFSPPFEDFSFDFYWKFNHICSDRDRIYTYVDVLHVACVHACIWLCVCVCLCISVCKSASVFIYVCVPVCVLIYVCIYICMYVCMYGCVCVYKGVRSCVYLSLNSVWHEIYIVFFLSLSFLFSFIYKCIVSTWLLHFQL